MSLSVHITHAVHDCIPWVGEQVGSPPQQLHAGCLLFLQHVVRDFVQLGVALKDILPLWRDITVVEGVIRHS